MKAKAKEYTSIPVTVEEFQELKKIKERYEREKGGRVSWGWFLLGIGIGSLVGYGLARFRQRQSSTKPKKKI